MSHLRCPAAHVGCSPSYIACMSMFLLNLSTDSLSSLHATAVYCPARFLQRVCRVNTPQILRRGRHGRHSVTVSFLLQRTRFNLATCLLAFQHKVYVRRTQMMNVLCMTDADTFCTALHTNNKYKSVAHWRYASYAWDIDIDRVYQFKSGNSQLDIRYGFLQVAQLSQRDRAAIWVSFDRNISERRYSVSNVVGARKLKSLIIYTTNALMYKKTRTLFLDRPSGRGLRGNVRCSS